MEIVHIQFLDSFIYWFVSMPVTDRRTVISGIICLRVDALICLRVEKIELQDNSSSNN